MTPINPIQYTAVRLAAEAYRDPQALHGCGITIDPEMDAWLEKQNKPYQQLDQLAAQLKATMKPSLYARLLCWIKRKML